MKTKLLKIIRNRCWYENRNRTSSRPMEPWSYMNVWSLYIHSPKTYIYPLHRVMSTSLRCCLLTVIDNLEINYKNRYSEKNKKCMLIRRTHHDNAAVLAGKYDKDKLGKT